AATRAGSRRHRQVPARAGRSALSPVGLAPRVVVLHAQAGNSRTVAMHQRLTEFDDQGVPRAHGYIHLGAQDEIVLWIVLISTVDKRRTAKGVARIERGPDVVVE